METIKSVIGVLGFFLALASLGWQFTTFRLSGGRVEALLKLGIVNGQFQVLGDADKTTAADLIRLLSEHGGLPVVGVEVRNVGRMAITVRNWGLQAPSGMVLSRVGEQIGPPLKHTIAASDSETWVMPFDRAVFAFAAVQRRTSGGPWVHLVGVVQLANGRSTTAKHSVGFDTGGLDLGASAGQLQPQ